MNSSRILILVIILSGLFIRTALAVTGQEEAIIAYRIQHIRDRAFVTACAVISTTVVPKIFQPYILPFWKIKYIALHHSQLDSKEYPKQLSHINKYHKQKFGSMRSLLGHYVGYNWLVEVDGTLIHCRFMGEETAAQRYHNFDVESICLAGNFNKSLPTRAQIETLRRFVRERPNLILRFHRDFQDRTCPGKKITKTWLTKVLD